MWDLLNTHGVTVTEFFVKKDLHHVKKKSLSLVKWERFEFKNFVVEFAGGNSFLLEVINLRLRNINAAMKKRTIILLYIYYHRNRIVNNSTVWTLEIKQSIKVQSEGSMKPLRMVITQPWRDAENWKVAKYSTGGCCTNSKLDLLLIHRMTNRV